MTKQGNYTLRLESPFKQTELFFKINIFKNLSIIELEKCRRVCFLWKNLIENNSKFINEFSKETIFPKNWNKSFKLSFDQVNSPIALIFFRLNIYIKSMAIMFNIYIYRI